MPFARPGEGLLAAYARKRQQADDLTRGMAGAAEGILGGLSTGRDIERQDAADARTIEKHKSDLLLAEQNLAESKQRSLLAMSDEERKKRAEEAGIVKERRDRDAAEASVAGEDARREEAARLERRKTAIKAAAAQAILDGESPESIRARFSDMPDLHDVATSEIVMAIEEAKRARDEHHEKIRPKGKGGAPGSVKPEPARAVTELESFQKARKQLELFDRIRRRKKDVNTGPLIDPILEQANKWLPEQITADQVGGVVGALSPIPGGAALGAAAGKMLGGDKPVIDQSERQAFRQDVMKYFTDVLRELSGAAVTVPESVRAMAGELNMSMNDGAFMDKLDEAQRDAEKALADAEERYRAAGGRRTLAGPRTVDTMPAVPPDIMSVEEF